jgi:plastocyanin
MNNQAILFGIGALVLVGLGGWFLTNNNQSAPIPTQNTQEIINQPPAVTHTLSLVGRKLTPDIVTVTQGDQVTIKVMSDETGEFHISGYEIENDMEVGKELSFSFTADKAGRYNFELHPKEESPSAFRLIPIAEASEDEEGAEKEDIVIGAFVVNPR